MLPGTLPILHIASGGGLSLELTYTTYTYATTHNGTFTFPADIESGDILLVTQAVQNTSDPSAAYGTGFTSLNTNSYNWGGKPNQWVRHAISYKIADGTEASSSIGGFMNGGAEWARLFVYRPNKAVSSVAHTHVSWQTTNNWPTESTGSESGATGATISYVIETGSFEPSTYLSIDSPYGFGTNTSDLSHGHFYSSYISNNCSAKSQIQGEGVDVRSGGDDYGGAICFSAGFIDVT